MNGSFCGHDDQGFLKDEVKTCLMALMSPLISPTISYVCTSILSMFHVINQAAGMRETRTTK
jgi:hypothetical protein